MMVESQRLIIRGPRRRFNVAVMVGHDKERGRIGYRRIIAPVEIAHYHLKPYNAAVARREMGTLSAYNPLLSGGYLHVERAVCSAVVSNRSPRFPDGGQGVPAESRRSNADYESFDGR